MLNFILRNIYSCYTKGDIPLIYIMYLHYTEQFLAYYVGLIPSGYYKVFNARDKENFLYHTLQALALFVAISVVSTKNIFVRHISKYQYYYTVS